MADQTYERLKESIYAGELQPGQKIVERNLAEQLGVSRIPLRESLVRLENEGLIRSVPYSSTYVEDFSPADMLEIYSMRLALEPLATRLAALHAEPGLFVRLRELCDGMSRCMEKYDFRGLDETDYEFHHAIVVASGHKRLLRAYESAHIRIVGLKTNYVYLLSVPTDQTARDHMAILESLEKRDVEASEKAADEHVRAGLVAIETSLGLSFDQARPEP